MKRNSVFALILLLFLLGGCGTDAAQPESTQATGMPAEQTVPSTETIPVTETVYEEETAAPETEPVVLPDAEELELKLSRGGKGLVDGSQYTRLKFDGEISLEVSVEEENLASLYLIWHKIPGQWDLTVEGETVTCGENGFLHEFIQLSEPTDSVTIRAPEGTELCDIYGFTYGNVPDWVQVWQPNWEKADLLVIPTHADDEVVFFGGLLGYYAVERDLKVQVVYMTDHSKTEYIRSHELLNCLWDMGVRAYPVIAPFQDKFPVFASVEEAKDFLGWDSVLEFQVELLRRFQPSVVVTHDLEGEYGHPAHIVTAQGMTEAAELAADSTYHLASAEEYGTWDTPKLYLHLYGDKETAMDWNTPLESFDGLTGYEVAELGWEAHKSQHGTSFGVCKDNSAHAGNLFGLYRSLVGEDTVGGDLFENIESYY